MRLAKELWWSWERLSRASVRIVVGVSSPLDRYLEAGWGGGGGGGGGGWKIKPDPMRRFWKKKEK